jgi:hypothetical protein
MGNFSRVYFEPTGAGKQLSICEEAFNAKLRTHCYLVLVHDYRSCRVHSADVYAKDRQDFENPAAD